jgi:hypothetical protein
MSKIYEGLRRHEQKRGAGESQSQVVTNFFGTNREMQTPIRAVEPLMAGVQGAERTRWPVALNAKQEFEESSARVSGVFLNKRRSYIPPCIYRRI